MPGVIRTRVGYTGGSKAIPTYHDMGSHTEAFQLDYDPKQITYSDLLDLFWKCHHPFSKTVGMQYRPVVFCSDDHQQSLANDSKAKMSESTGNQVYTEILPLGEFHFAEDYHQKYYLRQNSLLMDELQTIFASEQEFINSTLSARLNSYTAHHGFAVVLHRELADYGVSEMSMMYLLERTSSLDECVGGAVCGMAKQA